jgi:pyridoxamine 5'-phosphate oxidase
VSERWRPLEVADTDPDPLAQFRRWFDEALGEMPEREAITLVTASRDARPSARMVLLRHLGDDGLGWFSHYRSRKGREIDENPRAALLWYCEPLGRQVRVEGEVHHMSVEASDEYFAARPRGHQIGAHASAQSEVLASRAQLEERVVDEQRRFEGRGVPRPEDWGGFLLVPDYFEFWQHRRDRLHDRVRYLAQGPSWRRERLSP